MKKRYLIILTVLILLSVNVVSAYDFSNETISHDNSNDVLGDSSASFTTLKDEIASTPSGGVLELNKSYAYNESVDTVISKNLGIVMGKPITIDGKGHTFDGSNLSKIFTINRVSDVTLKNIVFKNAFNTGNGGAITVEPNSHNFKIDNCSFENCHCSVYGGALEISQSNNVWVTNCNFTDNSGDLNRVCRGGAIHWQNSKDGVLANCNFINNTAEYGGAVHSYGCSNTTQYNNVFESNSASSQGGDLWIDEENAVIRDCKFLNSKNNQKYKNYAPVHVKGSNSTLYNLEFVNTSGTESSGIYCYASNSLIYNCSFTNTSSSGYGAVQFSGKNNTIRDCNFKNSSASSGGAIYSSSDDNKIISNNFTDCKSTGIGGTIYLGGSNNVVENSLIENSRGSYGGAIYISGQNSTVNNTKIINASATNYGGAILLSGQYSGVYNTLISDSSAAYGGAIFMGSALGRGGHNGKIYNSTIDNCHATSNGGAVYLNGNYQDIVNSTFTNNVADRYGGAVYSNSRYNHINNSNMDGNNATVGSAIFKAGNYDTYINNVVFGANRVNSSSLSINKEKRKFNTTFRGFDNILNAIWNNDVFNAIFIDGVNPVDGAQNSDGGKLLYEDNREFNQTIIVSVLDENGNVLHTKSLKTGLYGEVNFTTYLGEKIQFSHPDDRFYTGISNSAPIPKLFVTGENKTSYVNQKVDIPVRAFDEFNDTVGEGTLSITIGGETFTVPANSTNVTITAPSTGGLYDLTITYTDPYGLTLSNKSSLFVWDPKIDVTKKAVNPVVVLKHRALFEINVSNVGNKNLSGVFVSEEEHSGLKFIDYSNHDEWAHSFVNNKHTWTLNKDLNVGESVLLFVTFDTDSVGKFINKVISGSTEALNKTAEANLTVIKSNLTVDKDCLTPIVVLGNQAKFEIIVNNTGKVDLSDVRVYEDSFDGLVYDSYVASDRWTCQIINSKPVWTFNDVLPAGEIVLLTVYFNTTKAGTFSNTAVVKSGKTDDVASACEVNVVKPEIKVEKVVLTPKVALGEQVRYEIVVRNTCKANLTNIVVEEMPDASLIFDHVDSGRFNHSVVSGKHIWTLDKLTNGTSEGFIIYFNTTASGNVSNKVAVKSDEVPEVIISNNTTVLLPAFTVKKISLPQTVVLGQSATFQIVIENTGKAELTNVYFSEDSFDGLIFDSASDDKNWTHKFENAKHTWTFNDVLKPGEIIWLTLKFNTTDSGKFTNYVSAGSDQTEVLTVNETVNVLKPEFKVEKIVLTPLKVALGEQVIYEIVVHNTGEANLTNIVVEEMPDASLVFDHYVDGGLFKHSVVSGKHIWTLDKLINGTYEGFKLYFNTTAVGNVSNRISVKSDEMPEEIISSNNTTVLIPAFTVEKICLYPNVLVGNQTQFEIVIKNTGKIELTNVYFTEDLFDGLIYDSAVGEGIWTHKFENGKHTWTLNDVLEPDEIIGLILIFNTTAKGNFTNFVSAGSDQTGVLTANASVHVFEGKVPEPPVQNLTSMDVFKTVITQDAVLGGQITFEIVVHNTGNTNLENVKISEILPEGLVYDHFVDYLNLWTYNNDLSWSATRAIVPGEYVGFFVTFNTTKAGKSVNTVNVSADKANSTSANTSFEVLNPAFTIEKILVEDNIVNGGQATFEIVIYNTGNAPLTNVTVKEYDFKGLIYNNFVDNFGVWTYNGDLSWTMNSKLHPGEYAVLSVTFNTTAAGNFTNFASAESGESGILIANATLHVIDDKKPDPEHNSSNDYKMDVFKIVITPDAVLGGQITFEIVVHNTGNTNLENVKISEILPEGLVYDHFVDNIDLWTYNGDLTWSATRAIVPGEYVGFFVTFNTTKAGKSVNNVNVSADKANSTGANTSFEVLNPDFTIEKILIKDNIANGGQATFEIVIHNTGNAPLTNMIVGEYFSEGLVYDHFVDYLDLWTYNGDLTWTMNSRLLPGEYVGFFVTFNTTKDGVFTNIVVANSTECDNRFSNNVSVNVHNETVDIRQICLTPLVIVGEQAIFEITVQNTGKINIDKLKLSEFDFEGLIYDHYMDYLGHWINDGITWTLNTTLVPGEVTSLFVVFNTTRVGNFTNVVLANNDVLDINDLLSANSLEDGIYVSADVEVVKPEYTIEKITLNKTVSVGQQVLFEIVVRNTGKVDIDDIVISESEIEGLVFDHFIDYMNVWINDGMTWRLNTSLHSGEVRLLYLAYNTTKSGNITNIITSGNLTSNATVEVNDNVKPVTNPDIAVAAEIVENPIFIGNTTLVKITVTNTGDVDLDNVFVDLMLNGGLIYDSMLGNWTYDNNRFNLNTVLRVGESSTFYVSVKALTAGNLSSIAYAGFNNTQISNSTFVIEVLNETAPANKTDNITDNTQAKVVKGAVVNNSAGNPLLLVLLSLMSLLFVNIRRKN